MTRDDCARGMRAPQSRDPTSFHFSWKKRGDSVRQYTHKGLRSLLPPAHLQDTTWRTLAARGTQSRSALQAGGWEGWDGVYVRVV
jgi:hypothetical protein